MQLTSYYFNLGDVLPVFLSLRLVSMFDLCPRLCAVTRIYTNRPSGLWPKLCQLFPLLTQVLLSYICWCPMSLDSTAVFAKRVEELKLAPALNDMLLRGWDTMGSFAFSC